nr:thioesterase family protein [uncultured Carboxylicivirga sp.]
MQSSIEQKTFVYTHRVGYAETDKMQFLHHSNYARLYENARWEYLRSLNLPYSTIEENGIMMPVINMDFRFIKPAFYDDILNVEVSIEKLTNVKISFKYATIKNNVIINTATVTLAFMHSNSGKATRIPEFIKSALENK